MQTNSIYKKIKIAFNLKDRDTQKIFMLAGMEVTRSFCRAISRSEDFEDYRSLSEKELYCFLDGLIIFTRGEKLQFNEKTK